MQHLFCYCALVEAVWDMVALLRPLSIPRPPISFTTFWNEFYSLEMMMGVMAFAYQNLWGCFRRFGLPETTKCLAINGQRRRFSMKSWRMVWNAIACSQPRRLLFHTRPPNRPLLAPRVYFRFSWSSQDCLSGCAYTN